MNKIYSCGVVFLFLGLLWMFLPHTAHTMITGEEEALHIVHTLEGFVLVVIGLGIMVYTDKKKSTLQED